MKLIFDVAEQTDIDVILNLMRQFYTHEKLPLNEFTAQDALSRLIADTTFGRVWLLKIQEKAIGYVILTFGYSIEFQGRDAFIDEIFIEEDYRGKGIGTKVIEFIESQCRESGIHAIHLEVERENMSAQSLYRKLGFQDHDRYLMTKWM
jgi:ribosomal protein S18 acetylase RimI-like enzyme